MRYSYFKGIAMQVAILALTGVSPCAAADKPIVHHQYVKSATTAAFSSSGDYIAVASDKRIWVFDANSLEQISEMVDYEYVNYKWKFQYRYGLGNSLEFVSADKVVTAGLGAMLTYSFISPKPDLSMALNGILAGLVGITAGADVIPAGWAIVVGVLAGGLVVGSVIALDKLKLDDPVGAVSVHLVCGIWGTLAVGLFSSNPEHTIGIQALGVLSYAAFTATCAAIIFGVLNATVGIRVSEEEELEGLDLGEHGMHAYDVTPSTGPFDDAHLRGTPSTAAATQLATEAN